MRRLQSGFTRIELLIVITIIGVLAVVLVPDLLAGRDQANALADQQNLRRHFQWLTIYSNKLKGLPAEDGHKFVLATWAKEVIEHTEENFDAFFTPGSRESDPTWIDLRKAVQRGEKIWTDLKSTNSQDTQYAGRAKEHMRTREQSAEEAWMANDNEGVWSLRDGTVNILFNGGNVRGYSYQQLQELYSLGPMDKNVPVQTWGPNSPIPFCQKLMN